MSAARKFLILMLLGVSLAGCSGGGTTTPAPLWQAGYSWSVDWEVETEWEETSDGERDNGTFNENGRAVVKILNTTTTSADGEPLYLGLRDQDGWVMPAVYRQNDLAPIDLDLSRNVVCVNGDCTTSVGGFEIGETGDEPRWIDFPIKKGKSWSDAVSEEEFDDLAIEWRHRSEVVGADTISTPLGDIDVIKIERTQRIANMDEIKALLRAFIEEDGGDVKKLEADLRISMTLYYAPEYLVTAQVRYIETSSFDIIIDHDGERYEESERSTSTYTEQLVGARLIAGPEQTLDDIKGLVARGTGLLDPTGEATQAPEYTLKIRTLDGTVNVAEGERPSYEVSPVGVDSLPAGHSVAWEARDWQGRIVAEGEGTSFEPELTVPGYYGVVARTHANGSAVAAAAAVATAHFIGTIDMECGLVEGFGNGVPSDCDEVDMPIHPGIRRATFDATTASPVDAANQNHLRITDGLGQMTRASEANPHHLQIEDFNGLRLSSDAWELDLYQELGLLEERVSVHVDLEYGPIDGFDPIAFADAAPLNWLDAPSASFLAKMPL